MSFFYYIIPSKNHEQINDIGFISNLIEKEFPEVRTEIELFDGGPEGGCTVKFNSSKGNEEREACRFYVDDDSFLSQDFVGEIEELKYVNEKRWDEVAGAMKEHEVSKKIITFQFRGGNRPFITGVVTSIIRKHFGGYLFCDSELWCSPDDNNICSKYDGVRTFEGINGLIDDSFSYIENKRKRKRMAKGAKFLEFF